MLRVAYDGSKYHGYQYQEGQNTIEGELRKILDTQLIGGSRTDAGVHALDNVVVFDTDSEIPADRYVFILNQKLPEKIRVMSSREVEPSFHPRKCASTKTYEYRIVNAPIMDPRRRAFACHCEYRLDVEKMQKAATAFIGEHDFTAFCAANAQVDSKVRTIYDISVIKDTNNEIVLTVSGNGFLYNMVRIIAGTLMDVGRGRICASDVAGIIESKDRTKAGPTAPACGLCLMSYKFDDYEEV